MVRIAIAGVGGRMGREILEVALADPVVQVVAGTMRPGATVESRFSIGAGLPVVRNLSEIKDDFDVLIDFTTPESTITHGQWCAEHSRLLVAGATGLSTDQTDQLHVLSAKTSIFYARNMSIGLNSLLSVLPGLVRALDGYDIEIVEAHHRHKADSPSGTALVLAEAIASATERPLENHAVYGRRGISPRTPGEIGIHSVRGGGNAGEHTVIFSDEGEEIQVIHRAFSRRTFALGAVRAAKFIHNASPGFYTMTNLLSVGT